MLNTGDSADKDVTELLHMFYIRLRQGCIDYLMQHTYGLHAANKRHVEESPEKPRSKSGNVVDLVAYAWIFNIHIVVYSYLEVPFQVFGNRDAPQTIALHRTLKNFY